MSELQPRIIDLEETESFEREGFGGQIYVKPEDGLGYSALLVSVRGSHPTKRMIGATRSYFIMDGMGNFTINGVVHLARPGELYVIPDGGEYSYQGEMSLWEFNVPGTTSANSITIEKSTS